VGDEIIVLITTSTRDEAVKIGTALVDGHLAACVNIVPEVRSLFFWDGKTQNDRETLLICKSRLPRMKQLVARVKSLHSYAVPEVIALPIVGGSRDYLDWVKDATRKDPTRVTHGSADRTG
jgi:periplasmic divalent cation tolerance protein